MALSFPGVEHIGDATSEMSHLDTDLTVISDWGRSECGLWVWVNETMPPPGNYARTILTQRTRAHVTASTWGILNGLLGSFDADVAARMTYGDGTAARHLSPQVITTQTWIHLVFQWDTDDPDNGFIWINGTKIAIANGGTTGTPQWQDGTPVSIGGETSTGEEANNRAFNGRIEHFWIKDGWSSDAAIAHLYTNRLDPHRLKPTRHYPMTNEADPLAERGGNADATAFGDITFIASGLGIESLGVDDMTDTGPQSPTSGTSNNAVGDTAWTNPGNILSNNASRATCALVDTATSQRLYATAFDFSAIPDDDEVTTITVEIDRSASQSIAGSAIRDLEVYLLKSGTLETADNQAALATDWPATASEAYATYTFNVVGWTGADVKAATSGVSIRVVSHDPDGLTPAARVDHVRMTVTHTEAAAGGGVASHHYRTLLLGA